MLGKKFNGSLSAEVTVEIGLSLALSIVVLILALGLFNDNIKSMASNGGIRNLFKSNEIAKVETDKANWGNNPARTEIHVQVVADQGLSGYVNKAKDKCKTYALTNPTTEAQVEDMAKQLTVLAIGIGSTDGFDSNALKTAYYSGDTSITSNQIENLKKTYLSNYKLNLQDDDLNYYGKTQLKNNGKFITYSSTYNGDTLPISVIKEVLRKNF